MVAEDRLTTEFNLPTHENEIFKAEEVLEKIRTKFYKVQLLKSIDNETHEKLYEEAMRVLYYVGSLSMPAFNIREELETKYTLLYIKSPQLGKKLFLDDYEKIHYNYNILKARCYRLLDDIDKEFFKRHKKRPRNW